MRRYFYDSTGDVLVRGTTSHDLAAAQVADPSVSGFIDTDEALLLKRDDGPYHRVVSGVPERVDRLTESGRDSEAAIHDYRPATKARLSYREIDYKTGLDRRLHRVDTIHRGEVRESIFYADDTETTPVVREDTTYYYDALGLPTHRDLVVSWYDRGGSLVPGASKTLRKTYSGPSALEASRRRRVNVYNVIQQNVLGMLLASGGSIEDGRAFLVSMRPDFSTWIDTDSDTALIAAINAATEPWLDAVVNLPSAGDTIRDYAIWELR